VILPLTTREGIEGDLPRSVGPLRRFSVLILVPSCRLCFCRKSPVLKVPNRSPVRHVSLRPPPFSPFFSESNMKIFFLPKVSHIGTPACGVGSLSTQVDSLDKKQEHSEMIPFLAPFNHPPDSAVGFLGRRSISGNWTFFLFSPARSLPSVSQSPPPTGFSPERDPPSLCLP